MSAPVTESMKLGQRSVSANNGSSIIRLELFTIFFTHLDGGCRTSGDTSVGTAQ